MDAITKCKGTDCGFRTSCYRYTAEDIGCGQKWLEKVPYENQSCISFAPQSVGKYFDLRREHKNEN
jgi:hypothetical protein